MYASSSVPFWSFPLQYFPAYSGDVVTLCLCSHLWFLFYHLLPWNEVQPSRIRSDYKHYIYAVCNLLASLQNKYDFFPFHFSGEWRQVGGKLERRDYTNIHFFNLHMKLKSLFCPLPYYEITCDLLLNRHTARQKLFVNCILIYFSNACWSY